MSDKLRAVLAGICMLVALSIGLDKVASTPASVGLGVALGWLCVEVLLIIKGGNDD